jgi:hypothetical protein
MHLDTSPEAEEVLFAFWRQAPAWQKWQSMLSLNQMARSMAIAGLRNRYPKASEAELRRLLADLILGPATAMEVYGPPPGKEDLK